MTNISHALCGALLCLSMAPALAPALAQDAPVAQTVQVPNGDMEAGAETPDGWKKEWVGQGEITLARETVTVHGGKAALRVEAKDATALAATYFDAPAGAQLDMSGWIKTAGTVKCSFGVSPRDKDWAKIGGDIQIGYLQNDTAEWLHAHKNITLPAGTQHVALSVYVEGTGQVWVDDVTAKVGG